MVVVGVIVMIFMMDQDVYYPIQISITLLNMYVTLLYYFGTFQEVIRPPYDPI